MHANAYTFVNTCDGVIRPRTTAKDTTTSEEPGPVVQAATFHWTTTPRIMMYPCTHTGTACSQTHTHTHTHTCSHVQEKRTPMANIHRNIQTWSHNWTASPYWLPVGPVHRPPPPLPGTLTSVSAPSHTPWKKDPRRGNELPTACSLDSFRGVIKCGLHPIYRWQHRSQEVAAGMTQSTITHRLLLTLGQCRVAPREGPRYPRNSLCGCLCVAYVCCVCV